MDASSKPIVDNINYLNRLIDHVEKQEEINKKTADILMTTAHN